ncbi:MAG: S8 family serine peptidase [Verrucomicrobiaceae bacterium]|nr:S8 family serine peptidase [Verrucomicrobiaceae bacterium]
MPARRFIIAGAIAIFAMASAASAQNSVGDVLGAPGLDLRDPVRRQNAVNALDALMTAKHQAARARAAQLGLPPRTVFANGRIVEIADFAGTKPLYFTTTNVNAAISTGANLLQAAPYSVSGGGFTVGIWDGGGVRSTHQELTGRVTIKDGAALADHSTHVGGTIGALGINAAAKGMAPAVSIDSYEWTNDKTEMTSRGASYPGEAGKIYLSNHSYGYVSGWNYTGLASPKWNWYGSGTTSTGFDPDFGKYETNARDTDLLAVSLPYYLIVRSAGNDRQDNPATGDPVSLSTSTTSAVTYDPALHPAGDAVYRGGGYDTISFDAVAKDVLTIGSVGDAVSGGTRSLADAYMSYYSSWGPTDDGRIKPDLVANGEWLYSSFSSGDAAYNYMSGTSMATPNATGSATLVIHWWDTLFPGHALRASTLKALLIETADDLGNVGPDYQYGWGLVNVKAAADLAQAYKNSSGTRRMIEDQITTTTTTRSYSFTWDGSSPIRATLCWTDPAGTATSSADLRTARLVNNLDLKVTGPTGTVHLPWVMPFVGDWTNAKLSAPAITGVNNTDNVERVDIAAPPVAGLYTATVTYTGTLTNNTQNFSLVLSGGVASATAPVPTLTTVSPNTGNGGAMTLSVAGTGFHLGANVKLTKSGQPDVKAAGQEIRGDAATVRVNTAGMAPGLWNVVVVNPDGQTATLANSFSVMSAILSESFESGAAGWTHSPTSPYTTDNWAQVTTLSHSTTHSFYGTGPTTKNIDDLYSPAAAIPAGSTNLQLSFWHNYNFQSAKDGGVLEFSVDGGAWFDVTATGSGAAFASGSYPSTISSSTSPINGRKAWSGNASSSWSQVIVNLTDNTKYAGHTFRARWRLATNTGTASTGWYVDDVLLAGAVPVVNLAPAIATAAAATPSPFAGTSTQLSVLGSDDGGESGLTYTWSAIGGTFLRPVSFSENGTNAAKNTTAAVQIAGDYTFAVTVRDAQGLTATSSVDVTVEQTAAGVTVTPASATVAYGGTLTFAATVADQFGDNLAVQPAVTWSASGGGSIDAAGVFTASVVGGPFTITAASGAFSDAASVAVTKANATVTLGSLAQIYDGNPKPVSTITSPSALATTITYNGSATAPSDFGSYAVFATIVDANYQGTASGTLTISGLPLATWQSQNFTAQQITAGEAADTADPDHDGLENLAEYALGTDPNQTTPAFTPSLGPPGFSLTFTRPKGLPDVTCAAESTTDLITWTPLTLTVVTDGPVQTVRVTDPLTSGDVSRRFVRLKFTR